MDLTAPDNTATLESDKNNNQNNTPESKESIQHLEDLKRTVSQLKEEIKHLKDINDNTNKVNESNILPQNNLGYQEIKLIVKDKCDTLEEKLKEEDQVFDFLKGESQKGTINGIIGRHELTGDLANFYFLRQMKERGLFNWDTTKHSYSDQKRAVAAAIQSNTWSL